MGVRALADRVHGCSDPQELAGPLQGHDMVLPPAFTSWAGAGGDVTASQVLCKYCPLGLSQERLHATFWHLPGGWRGCDRDRAARHAWLSTPRTV